MSPLAFRRTVRLRLTLLYGCIVLVAGVALLTITILLVTEALDVSPGTAVVHDSGVADAPQIVSGPGGPKFVSASSVVHGLLASSGLALAITVVLACAAGWFAAGRMLRPLRTMTATVRDIEATNLHRRLAMAGPTDELKELGDTFDGLLARLDSVFHAQRQFVANASHELRTPLARQRVIGQVVLADPNATPEALREAHELILDAGAQQQRLIDALLTLARGQAGVDTREPLDLAVLALDATTAHENATATIREVTSPAWLTGHRSLLQSLIANLVDNAVRHNVPDGWVEVRTATIAGRATFAVSNTGPLIEPGAVDALYQPFHRRDGDRTGTDGIGLGLAIVHAVAHAHDATLDTVARPDGGLTVTVSFP
jgi:signal transduction histidine kinase